MSMQNMTLLPQNSLIELKKESLTDLPKEDLLETELLLSELGTPDSEIPTRKNSEPKALEAARSGFSTDV